MPQRIILLPLICLICICNTSAQLTEAALEQAVQNQQCHLIAPALDTLQPATDKMKFNAAVCLYRNGQADRALLLFKEVHGKKGDQWALAAFWEAKILALLEQDAAAVEVLAGIPQEALSYGMLSQKEFFRLSQTNDAFNEIKKHYKPHLNIWTSILLFMAIVGFITGMDLLLGKSKFTAGEKWLSQLVFSFTLILLAYLTIWTKYVHFFPYLRNTWPFLTLMVGPSLYFYLKETFKEDYTRKNVLLHFSIPALSFLLTSPAILHDFGIHIGRHDDLVRIGSSATLLTSHIVAYTIIIHYMLKNDWQVDANIRTWSRILSWGLKLYAFAFLSYFILVNAAFFNPQWDYTISIVMALGIAMIAYMGLLQKRVFSSEPVETILSVKKYQSSTLTPAASETIRIKLEKLLTEDQVFKENELRLDDLASYLNITRHQLSQVINEHYKVNFFELLNRYRIAYVRKILLDPSYANYTIMQIAYEAGFNNKASFNKYFKREIGLTPSAYRLKEGVVQSAIGNRQ